MEAEGAIFMTEDKVWQRTIFCMLEVDTLPCSHNELLLDCSAVSDP